MSTTFVETLSQSRVLSRRLAGEFKATARRESPTIPSLTGPDDVSWGRSPEQILAEEQAKHYGGRVYAAVTVAVNRVIKQGVMVGRVVPRGQRAKLYKARPLSTLKGRVEAGAINPATVPEFVSKSPATDDGIEILESHRLLDVLQRPNGIMRWSHLMQMTIPAMDMTGRAYWLFGEVDGQDTIIPTPPHWVKPDHGRGDNTYFESYLVAHPGYQGQEKRWPGDQVARFFEANPFDPLGFYSKFQAIARTVLSDEAMEVSQEATFRNSIKPSFGIITGDPKETAKTLGVKLTTQGRAEIMRWVQREYAGALKHGLPVVMDALVRDFKRLFPNPVEMDWLDSGKATGERIFQGFSTSPIVSGRVEDVNRASSAEADYHFVENRVAPLCVGVSEVLTDSVGIYFVEYEGEQLVVWIPVPTPRDAELAHQKAVDGFRYGATMRSEFRSHLGLPSTPADDVYHLPATVVVVPAGEETTAGDGEKRRRIEGTKSATDKATDARDNWQIAWERLQRQIEGRIARAIEPKLREWYLAAADHFDQLATKDAELDKLATGGLPSEADGSESLWGIVKGLLSGAAGVGSLLTLKWLLPEGDDLRVPDVEPMSDPSEPYNWLQAGVAAGLVSGLSAVLTRIRQSLAWTTIVETTRSEIRQIVAERAAAGVLADAIADELRESAGRRAKARATMIARTESTGALNAGVIDAGRVLAMFGRIVAFEWLCVADDQTRLTHWAVSGTQVKPGETWTVGGYQAAYPGDPSLPCEERCNCRCGIFPIPTPQG